MQVEAARITADRRLGAADAAKLYVSGHQRGNRCGSAAHEDLLDGETLVFKKAFGDSDAVGELVVPRETDENDAKVFLFLGVGVS